MPVTVKLSHKFYDRFGEQVANELVDWFNQVDATYKSDLRELNEQNFQRFDAKLQQRMAESDARRELRFSEFRLELGRLENRMESGFGDIRSWVHTELAAFDAKLTKRMFYFWAGTVFPLIGVMIALMR